MTMADTQNSVSSQDPTTPATTPVQDVLGDIPADLLGDISLEIPAGNTPPPAPVEQPVEVAPQTSDLGSVMLEQSIDATQQKAESAPLISENLSDVVAQPLDVVVENTPTPVENITLDLPVAPSEEVKTEPALPAEEAVLPIQTEAPVVTVPEAATIPAPSSDALNIDLGDLSSSAPAESTSEDSAAKRVFKPLEADIEGPAVAPAVAPVPATDPSLVIPNLPAAEGGEEAAVTSIEAPLPAPFIEPAPETAPVSVPVVENPAEPTLVETLTNNEQQHIESEAPANDTAIEIPVIAEVPVVSEEAEVIPAAAATVNETTLDLDSLTSDIAAATAGNGTVSPTVAQSSVTLPVENTAILKPHSSLKKKVFVSLAGFILLATVGVMVAKVMCPIESDKLIASIL